MGELPKSDNGAKITRAFRPIKWPTALAIIGGAVACFHIAYAPSGFALTHLLMVGYLIGVAQLSRLNTTRQSFYAGLLTGFFCAAPQLTCFWKIFGAAAIPLWLILALWIGLFTVNVLPIETVSESTKLA